MARGKARSITPEHREAITAAHLERKAIAAYLEALTAPKPHGKPRSPAELRKLIGQATTEAEHEETPTRRLAAVQRRLALEAELAAAAAPKADGMPALEAGFIKHARDYSARKGITYEAWREIGITPTMLRRAGITRNGE